MILALDIKKQLPWIYNNPDWKKSKVKNLFRLSDERSDSEDPKVLSLTLNGVIERDISNNEGQLAESYQGYKLVRRGDIIFNPMDLLSGYVDKSDFEGVISPAYTILRPKVSGLDLDFFKYYFQSHYTSRIFHPFGKGVSLDHRWELKDKDLLEFPIVIPPLDTQKKVINYLDDKIIKIDLFTKNKQEYIEKLVEQKNSIIINYVCSGVKQGRAKRKSDLEIIGSFPADWKIWKMARIFQIIGSGTTPDSGNREYYENADIPWVNSGDLNDGNLLETRSYVNSKALDEYSTLKRYKKNCLIVAMYGATVGKISISNIDVVTNQACCVLNDSNVALNEFIFYWFIAKRNEIIILSNGGGQPNISMDIISKLNVALPSIDEQKKIVELIKNDTDIIDKAIEKAKKQLKLIKEYRASLVTNTVTGEIRL